MRNPIFAALLTVLVSIFQLPLAAQPSAPAESQGALVEVSAVKFDLARNGSDNWLETVIELAVKPGGRQVTGEFVDRIRVTLSIMVEGTSPKGEKQPAFYRSSVELITLEGGVSAVRFYLPPEIVKRDRLRADAAYYVVDVEAAGKPQPLGRGAISRNFASPESVKSFQTRVTAESGTNEGVLMPQYLTPFDGDPRRVSPSFLRREARR
jgi:hypothetical protein